MHRHELTDEEWARIQPLIRIRPGPRAARGDRNFVNAVIWRVRTGVAWRDLHERYGPWKSVYNRFARWAALGIWERIFKELRVDTADANVGSIIDATVVRAHQDAAGGKGGSDAMVLAVLEEAFRPRSTRSPRRAASRSR